MNRQLPLAAQIEEWTREAATQCGDDWKHVWAYIQDRLNALDAAERERLMAEAELTLQRSDAGATLSGAKH